MTRLTIPCAIYTRKSSEEGLEQDFNSLDAQREACAAYILSQQHEGWRAIPTCYDDGGYSGGNMDRPALKRLLEDIDQKKIKVVVVYKVDRLTRSLADFAKIVEQFDATGVSFVSVTQQFNTTSSMGRLTLNVLLSFAQFEREVTGERIRDKIAASKQKGMWMGGTAPIGYLGKDRTLVIDEKNANLILHIYKRYLALGNVRQLKEELDTGGIRTPERIRKSGKSYGGKNFSKGHLYIILSNPVYIGQMIHKDKTYPGQHPAITPQDLWNAVQAKMAENKKGYKEKRAVPSASLLTGLLFDPQGHRLIPSHSQKQSKRYRYYVSEPLLTDCRDKAPHGLRLPAQELESMVIHSLCNWLSDTDKILDAVHVSPENIQAILSQSKHLADQIRQETPERYQLIRQLIQQIIVHSEYLQIEIDLTILQNQNCEENRSSEATVILRVPVQVKRCGLAVHLLISGSQTIRQAPDDRLIRQIAKAHDWFERLTSGKAKSIRDIAAAEGVTNSYVRKIIHRAFLAPDIVRAILNGTQPPDLTLESLKKFIPLPIDWNEQRKLLGFPQA
jgi:DNA invertase Pin-like site-specific DNA recombinase